MRSIAFCLAMAFVLLAVVHVFFGMRAIERDEVKQAYKQVLAAFAAVIAAVAFVVSGVLS